MVKKRGRSKASKGASRSSKTATKSSKNNHNDSKRALAIAGLILNILIMPGLGSVVGGRIKEGIWQLVLFWVGVALAIVIVGIPLIIAAWIWALVSGIKMVKEVH